MGKNTRIEVDCDLDKEQRNGKVSTVELSYYQSSLIRSRMSVSAAAFIVHSRSWSHLQLLSSSPSRT